MKKNKKKLALLAILFAMCVSILVPMNAQAASKKKIKLNKTKVQLVKGTKYQLKLKDKNGKTISYKSIKFSSKNKKIATVNKKGKITAKKNGTTYIYAKCKGKKYKCKVVVFTAKIKTNIKIGSYFEGNSRKAAMVRPVIFRIQTSRTVPIKYKSLDTSKAKVTSKGKVTFRDYDSIEALDYVEKYNETNLNEAKIQITLGDSKVTKVVPYNGMGAIIISDGDEDDEYWKMCWNDEYKAADVSKLYTYDEFVSLYDFFEGSRSEELIKYSKSQVTPITHEGLTFYKYYRPMNTADPEFDWSLSYSERRYQYKALQNEKGQFAYVAQAEASGYRLLIWR